MSYNSLSFLTLTDHEQSMVKYMKQPTRKDDKSRLEVNEELFQHRKKFHQVYDSIVVTFSFLFLPTLLI